MDEGLNMDKFQKYAELQKTVWKKWENTTLGNLPAEQFEKIDSEYEKMIAGPSVEGPKDDADNGGQADGSDKHENSSENGIVADGTEKVGAAETEAPSNNVDPVGDQGPVDATVSETTSEMADTETGFDDEVKAGE